VLLGAKHILGPNKSKDRFVDQATATIVGAVIGLSGTVTAAIIAILWKGRVPQRHIYEYRVLHHLETEREPWLHGNSRLPRMIRGVGWIIATVLMFIGVNSFFASGAIWFESHETSNRGLKLWALCSTGSLALLVGYWLAKRIELPRETNDIDDDDDDE
jgi:hypothetical protein